MNILYIFQYSSNISTLQGRFDQMLRRGVSTKGRKKPPLPRERRQSLSKSLAEFAARRRQIKCNPFLRRRVRRKNTSGLQVWNLFAFSEQIMRAADCSFCQKKATPFLTS